MNDKQAKSAVLAMEKLNLPSERGGLLVVQVLCNKKPRVNPWALL